MSRQKTLLGRVIPLLFWRCPPDVSRFVVAVGVGIAIKRMLWTRWFAHIGEEILELSPSFAHRNASTAVAVEMEHIWIKAPLKHGLPNSMNSRASKAVSFTGQAMFVKSLDVKTAATFCLASAQVVASYYDLFATTALA